MKKILLLAIAVVAFATVSAQNKGDKYVGGIIGVSTASVITDLLIRKNSTLLSSTNALKKPLRAFSSLLAPHANNATLPKPNNAGKKREANSVKPNIL